MDGQTVSRRSFLQAGVVAAAAATTARLAAKSNEDAKKQDSEPLPRRALGRTGMDVTILEQGEFANVGDRHLNVMHAEGVRCLDLSTWADGKHERTIGEWLNKTGRRKEYCVVTKDYPSTPDQWVKMLDRRLNNGRQDYYDLYFLHGLGGGDYPDTSVRWPVEREWAGAAERMKKSGKTRFVGFSLCCDPIQKRTALLNHAAQGGWVDAIMVAVDPSLIRDNAEFNKALDACHKSGIGLFCMKTTRGLGKIQDASPEFAARGISPYAAVLTAVWTDERFSTICIYMDNIAKLKENASAARRFRPMTDNESAAVHRMLDGHPKSFCIGCDGSCRRAAGTKTAFSDIARYLCYYEENGDRVRARRLFAALPPEARDWSHADLAAASSACTSRLDFSSILTRVAEKLA